MEIKESNIYLNNISREYEFIHISDAHAAVLSPFDSQIEKKDYERSTKQWGVTGRTPAEELLDIAKYADSHKVDGLLVAGDIIDYVNDTNIKWLTDLKKNTKTEMYLTYGNHEGGSYISECPGRKAYGEYKEIIPGDPDFWTKDFGDFLLVGIDNSDHNIEDSQLAKFEEVLKGTKPIILLVHIPIFCDDIIETVEKRWGKNQAGYFLFGNENDMKNNNVRKFLQMILADNVNIAAILAGHIHTSYEGTLDNGVPMFVSDAAYTGNVNLFKVKEMPSA